MKQYRVTFEQVQRLYPRATHTIVGIAQVWKNGIGWIGMSFDDRRPEDVSERLRAAKEEGWTYVALIIRNDKTKSKVHSTYGINELISHS